MATTSLIVETLSAGRLAVIWFGLIGITCSSTTFIRSWSNTLSGPNLPSWRPMLARQIFTRRALCAPSVGLLTGTKGWIEPPVVASRSHSSSAGACINI